MPQTTQHRPCAIPVLHRRRRDLDLQNQSQRIHQQMPLPPDHVLAGIVTTHTTLFGGLDAWAVDNSGGRGGTPTGLQASPDTQEAQQLFPKTGANPVLEVSIHGAPMGKVARQLSPSAPGAE
jgi:hypothetical protein